MGALTHDLEFYDRVIACSVEQAQIFVNDARPEFSNLATAIIAATGAARGVFDLVCTSPNFRDVDDGAAAPDGDILAAVQAVWPVYGAAAYPEPQP
jgi:hypothetical protein